MALLDLLVKPELIKQEISRIKKVAQGLLDILSIEVSRIQDFSAKQATRDEIKVKIRDYLWDDKTGLPDSFGPEEIEEKADVIFAHVLMGAKSDTFVGHVRE